MQIGFETHEARSTAAHRGLIRDRARRVVTFCNRQRDISFTHGFLGTLQARVDGRQANSRRDANSMLAQIERCLQRFL